MLLQGFFAWSCWSDHGGTNCALAPGKLQKKCTSRFLRRARPDYLVPPHLDICLKSFQIMCILGFSTNHSYLFDMCRLRPFYATFYAKVTTPQAMIQII